MNVKNSSPSPFAHPENHEMLAVNDDDDDATTVATRILDYEPDQDSDDCRNKNSNNSNNKNGRCKYVRFHTKTPNQDDDDHPPKKHTRRRRFSIKAFKTIMRKKLAKFSVSFRLPSTATIGRFVHTAKMKVESFKQEVRDRVHLAKNERNFRDQQMFLVRNRRTLGDHSCYGWQDRLDGRMNEFSRFMSLLDSPDRGNNDHADIVKQYYFLCHKIEDLHKSFRSFQKLSKAKRAKVAQGPISYSEWKIWKSDEFLKWFSDEVRVAKSILSFYSRLDQVLGPESEYNNVRDYVMDPLAEVYGL